MAMHTEANTAAPRENSTTARLIRRAGFTGEREFILRVVQPALVGLIDGTVSSLARSSPPRSPRARIRRCSWASPPRWARA